jgi:hypothetical protein
VTDEAPKKKRTWIPIVIGVVILLAFVAIGIVGVGISYLRQSMTVVDASESDAMQEFEKVRSRFAGQRPLIEMVDGRPQYDADRATQTASQTTLNTLHVLAYDRDKGQTVTFTLPFWLLRMKSGPIRISAYQQGWDDRGVSFRVEDIEKHGPGIIVDATRRGEGRVLVWAE